MGGVRNGKSAGTPEPAAARQDALRAGMPDVRPEEAARDSVDRHLRSAVGVLREGSAARAFGQLARASRTEPMTPRLAAALVRFALLAGTEPAAITLLEGSQEASSPDVRRAVRRQLARVLRRVGQVSRAISALEAVLAESPEDRRARLGLQVLRRREAQAGEPAAGGAVLGKLPTRKAGVQAPAVWDESSGYREDTQADSASGAAVPREKTAVAFPSAVTPETRERTAVAFPTAPPPAPHVPWSVPGAEEPLAGSHSKTETELPAVVLPTGPAALSESRSKTAVELPVVVADVPTEKHRAMAEASASDARKTVMEMPAVGASVPEPRLTVGEKPSAVATSSQSGAEARPTVGEKLPARVAPSAPAIESRPTVLEMPAIGATASAPAPESRKSQGEAPAASTAPSQPASGQRPAQHLSVPWPESPSEAEDEPPARDSRPPSPRSRVWADEDAPPARDSRPPSPRPRAWADDETTGEVTSEVPPLALDDAQTRGVSRAAPSPERAPAAQPSPVETQEVSMADLEAALAGASRSGVAPARGEAPPAVQASPPPSTRAEELEELVRSQKLEAQLIARQAWRELAQLYLKRADRAKDATVRAEALTRLAEVMENELQDPAGAARMYREIVELTGDRAALREQVRLLSTRGDASLVRRALDEAIQRAHTSRARAGALLTRGERWLHMGDPRKARGDFEAAEALAPGMLPVLAGLLRCVSTAERPAIAERLRVALAAAPRRTPDRLEGLRLLAQAAEESLGDLRMAQWAWTEVLAESPDSEQARTQLLALARKLGDPKALGQLLRAQLARESRGPAARQARLELVATLDALGDDEGALNELRQAVRYEPGHKEAWLLLVDRLTARGNMGEAAWALEHAATAMEDEQEREHTWERLAKLWRDVLRNPERAQVYARRAESLRQAREQREPPPPEPPRSATPRREPSGPKSPLVPAPPTLSLTPSGVAALADETTSNTDVGAMPGAVEAPAPKPSARAKARAERAQKKGAPAKDAPASGDERQAAPPPAAAASPRGQGTPAQAEQAVAAPTAAPVGPEQRGSASPARTEQRASVGVSPASGSPATSPVKSEQRAAAAPPPAKADPRASPIAGPTASSPARAEPRASAAPPARAPRDVEPAAKPRGPASRKDKGAAPPRPPPQLIPDDEPSVAATRALGFTARPPEPPTDADLMDDESMALGDAPVPDTRVISWEAPPGRMDPVRRIVRTRPEGTVSVAAPSRPAPAKPPPEPAPRVAPGAAETRESPAISEPSPDTEPNFFRHLRERPLDPKPYRESAEYFDSRKDTGRATLMREIADALEGREVAPPPRPQRPPLTSEERAGLRHPGLRTPSGELLACAGLALCRLFPAQGRAAGTSEPLRATSGPGAPAVLDALHAAARVLDVHLPELVLAEDEGPPFTAVHAGQPRLLVGRLAVQQPPSAAELRFHAGRALLSLSPDLLALRALKGGQLLRALALLSTILKDPRASSPEARVVRESLSPRALERAVALLEPGTQDFNASALADAARDSANRAGLVACGGMGPALAVLRARHNPDAELVELLRFAASERYLELRAPR